MIHITETYSLTDCLYLCSIKPTATQTDLVISWHQHAQKHILLSGALSDSHESEYNSQSHLDKPRPYDILLMS